MDVRVAAAQDTRLQQPGAHGGGGGTAHGVITALGVQLVPASAWGPVYHNSDHRAAEDQRKRSQGKTDIDIHTGIDIQTQLHIVPYYKYIPVNIFFLLYYSIIIRMKIL